MRTLVALCLTTTFCAALAAGQRTPELDLVGIVAFNSQNDNTTFNFTLAEVRNNRPSGVSGLLKLQVICTTEKVGALRDGEALPGTVAFSADIGTLPAGFSQTNVMLTGPFTPPQGTQFASIVLVETTGGGDLVWDGEVNAFRTLVEGASIRFIVTPPEPLVPPVVYGRVGAPFSLVIPGEKVLNGYTAAATGLPKGLVVSRDKADSSRSKLIDPFVISGTPTKAGTFPVTFTISGSGLTGSATTTFVITDKKTNAQPNIVDIQALPDRTAAGNRITFVADAEDPENSALSYTWDFGDNSTAMGQQVFHTYANPGTYTVTLSVADGALTTSQTTSVEITGTPSQRPIVDLATASPNPTAPNTVVTFTATASDPQGLPLTLRWNFGDGSAPLNGNPVTHTYAAAGDYPISVTATNSLGLSTTFSDLTVFVQNDTDTLNIDSGDVRQSSELLQTEVLPSRNAVIALKLGNAASAGAAARDADFLTVFRIPGRSAKIYKRGTQPVNRFQRSGVALAFSRSTPADSGEFPRRGRKQVAISGKETAEKGPEDTTPVAASRRVLDVASISGKFTFNADNADSVKLSATFEIPNTVDELAEQEFSIGIGGVVDRVRMLKGKTLGRSDRGIIKKASLKAAKDKTLTDAKRGKLTLELNAPNLDAAGFDTDGITVNGFKQGKTNPAIQVSVVYAGISYKTAEFPVTFTLSSNETSGKINGRRAK